MSQAPQWLGFVSVSTHELPQRANPELQVKSHVPPLHTAVPLAGASQALLHAPQWLTLTSVSAHTVPHSSKPSSHAKSHVPAEQVRDPFDGTGQALPHIPQLSTDVCVSTQEPPQSTRGAVQLSLQPPRSHTWPVGHRLPQVPQLSGSL